jgi:hypothetical protein
MSGVQMGNFIAFAQKFDFSKYKTLTDAGGSSGLLSLTVAKHQPHMTCTSFDLPPVEPIANEIINQFQLGDRVKQKTEISLMTRYQMLTLLSWAISFTIGMKRKKYS